MIRILGIDPGSRTTGYGVLEHACDRFDTLGPWLAER